MYKIGKEFSGPMVIFGTTSSEDLELGETDVPQDIVEVISTVKI